jgi:hypothetical protein
VPGQLPDHLVGHVWSPSRAHGRLSPRTRRDQGANAPAASPTAGGPHTWRVRNPEQVAVDFNAEVLGTRQVEIHIGTVPANGEATFQTQVPGPDVVALFVGGVPVNLGICLR